MALTVKLFDGFELSNPIWIASSHLSESVQVIRQWQRIVPSAITLKTTSARGGVGEGSRLLRTVRSEGSLYSDGEKSKELLNYTTSRELLTIAKRSLPQSKVGSSILMKEDYAECLKLLAESDFFELNLKYSVRTEAGETIASKFEHDQTRFNLIVNEVAKFLSVYKDYPCFIKFTREIDWLGDFREFKQIMDLIGTHPRAGIILANTKKWVMPSSSTGLADELRGGIVAGQELFQETYNTIARVRSHVPSHVPVIATGGINTVRSAMDVFRLGVRAIQVCTALQLQGLGYYRHMVAGLETIREQLRARSFDTLLEKIQNASIVWMAPLFDYHGNFYSYEGFDALFEANMLDMVLSYGRTFTRNVLVRNSTGIFQPSFE